MTAKQKLQKDRAWFKFVLAGLYKPINQESLTGEEQRLWNIILTTRMTLLECLETQSAVLGLKIPEFRCWCGKEGKYDPESIIDFYGSTKVCKKHIKND